MSLTDQRADLLRTRRDEAVTLASQHRLNLRRLYKIHATIHANNPLSALVNSTFEFDEPDADEALFLAENDLSRGFSAKTLTLLSGPPTPQPQRDADPIPTLKHPSDPSPTSGQTGEHARPDAPSQDVAAAVDASQATPSVSNAAGSIPLKSTGPSVAVSEAAPTATGPLNDSVKRDDPSAAPSNVAPPLPDEAAELPDATQQYLDQRPDDKPADTVHLPPKEVQEERLREREAAEQRRKQSDVDSKASQRLAAPQTEAASSPSSTVAYSAATPQANQETSDTSPDSEHAHEELTPPKDLQPSADEQRRKEEHDRQLEAQKELARQKGLGETAATPDDQLRLEEREAAARDAEERAAREDVGGPEYDSKNDRNSTEAAKVVEEMEVDAEAEQQPTKVSTDSKSAPGESVIRSSEATSEENAATLQSQKSSLSAPAPTHTPGHNQRATSAESAEKHSTPAPSRREGMTTRVSSGAMRHKSVSEILGSSQSPAAEHSPSQKEKAPSASLSPMTQRHPQETPRNAPSAQSLQSHRQLVRSPPSGTASMSLTTIEQLEALKGAAEDPEKDYLEALFRIQAHDLAGSGTKSLPDLLKMGKKSLTTEDHFTAMHERLDYRMLRRIYQLQNANKWSLRQMEKCKEPEQPVTHHDHMMEEMKWMRKDFKAERKMKKSVCALLARSCADWVAADPETRKEMQVKVKPREARKSSEASEGLPDLEHAGDSAGEEDIAPPTPREGTPVPVSLVVAPELEDSVKELEKHGKLSKALASLPQTGLLDPLHKLQKETITKVSKFIGGKVLPKSLKPSLKRSRYEYEDEAEIVESQPNSKRLREEVLPEDTECALFNPDNKPIRDRLHSNNAFRPPSEFLMPSISFYEFRTGSQWIWEDDQKLKKLAKEYSFNWSLISDEMALPSRYKSSAERRTPWECFERWVELESLPADMRKTVYFKTWFQRLEQSQQAAEQRYQRQVHHIQQNQPSGSQAQVPPRRRTIPTRVEKRRSARYLWLVDGFRKLAKKREQAAWKQAETARAAAQRKSQAEANPAQKMVKMTPQEFSKKRQERDQQAAEYLKQQRLKHIEAQRQQLAARQSQLQQQQQQQQGMQNGMPNQQRPQIGNNPGQQVPMQPNGQQVPNMGGQAPGQQQLRPGVPMAPQRNGHLAPPQVNAQGIPQAQMQARMAQHPNMQQQIAQANAQGRNPQYQNQQFQMPNGNMQSPGGTNLTNQQQLQQNQALLQALHQQQHSNNGHQTPNGNQSSTPQQMSASPSMPPPPTPQGGSQQLSSGHVPQIVAIKDRLRTQNPSMSEADLNAMATQQMKQMSQSQMQSQSTSQMRQSAMSAAAGIPNQQQNGMQAQQYGQNQGNYQRSGQMMNGMNGGGVYMNGDGNNQQANISPAPNSSSPSEQQQRQLYQQKMYRQQLQHTQQLQMQSPHVNHAQLNGSPNVAHASPNMTPASPSMQLANNSNQMSGGVGTPTMNGQRPPSRSNTPQMQRLGSAGSGAGGMGNGMQSPGAMQQGSPRNVQANMAR